MINWKNADSADLKRLNIISTMLHRHPKLLAFLFSPSRPELNGPPAALQKKAGGFSSGERVLINLALDIWSEGGNTKLNDLYVLDPENFKEALRAIIQSR